MTVLPYYMARRRLATGAGEGEGEGGLVVASGEVTTATIAGVNFGAEAADRVLVLSAAISTWFQARGVTSVIIGGVTATIGSMTRPGPGGSNHLQRHGNWAAAVPEGTSGDIVITLNGAVSARNVSYVLYRLTGTGGSADAKATDAAWDTTAEAPRSVSVAVQDGDVLIAGACTTNQSSPGPIAISGVSETLSVTGDVDAAQYSQAHGAESIHADGTAVVEATCGGLSAAVYGPA